MCISNNTQTSFTHNNPAVNHLSQRSIGNQNAFNGQGNSQNSSGFGFSQSMNFQIIQLILQMVSSLIQQLQGNANNNPVNTGAGNDAVNTGAGNDKITGGPGADTFNTGIGDTINLPNGTSFVVDANTTAPVAPPAISEADQKVIDYVNDRQGKWLVKHGEYEGKSTGQDNYTFKKGPLKGYTACYVADGKYDIHNPDGKVIAQHDAGKDKNKVASPVALDLNNDGKIGTTGETTAKDRLADTQLGKTVQFDIDGNGSKDTIEWMNGDGDGLLVDTREIGANNEIDGNALFGDQGGKFNNGYDKMALLDSNNDNQLSGSELDHLSVWVDDGDAKLEDGELRSLESLGIHSLGTNLQNTQNARGETLMQSNANGGAILTEDVWFGKA